MNDEPEPEIKPVMSNEELQTAINVIIAANRHQLSDCLAELVLEQVRRAKLWKAN